MMNEYLKHYAQRQKEQMHSMLGLTVVMGINNALAVRRNRFDAPSANKSQNQNNAILNQISTYRMMKKAEAVNS